MKESYKRIPTPEESADNWEKFNDKRESGINYLEANKGESVIWNILTAIVFTILVAVVLGLIIYGIDLLRN